MVTELGFDAVRGPSAWAVARFGTYGGQLTGAVPRRLGQAHARAVASHEAAGLRKFSKYGPVLAERILVELAEEARGFDAEPRILGGREYAVIAGHALFPFRYADRALPLGKARLRSNTSQRRRRLLTAHAQEQPALFEVDDDLTTDQYEELHRVFEELGESTKLVSVFFTSDVSGGIHQIWWGDAHLETDRTFRWSYTEPLTVASTA